jgi:hypothetical protein
MQYAVPQFTDVEDKLIGPLTLKQFLMLLGTGGVILFFWSIFSFNILFFLFALPVGIAGIAVSFGRLNGRAMSYYVAPLFSFMSKPRVRIFKKEEGVFLMSDLQIRKSTNQQKQEVNPEPTQSRLKKLAYLLDQKTTEEEELIKESVYRQ